MCDKSEVTIQRSAPVMQAERLARHAHEGQVDKLGVDYMEHVHAVASAVRHLGEVYEMTGLLHDTVEDCPNREIVSFSIIENLFGADVRNAVECITKRENENYDLYLKRVASNPVARAVKLADLRHNQSRLHLLRDAGQRDRLEIKYSKALKILSL